MLSLRLAQYAVLFLALSWLADPASAQIETLATPQLLKTAEEMIKLNGAVRAPCNTVRVLRTEIVKWPADARTDLLPLKAWKECWTVDQCGTGTTYRIEFKPNLRGGVDVEVRIPGLGAAEPSPPATLDANLLEAAELGNLRLIERLLAEGADTKSSNENGRTPFIGAASSGHLGAARLLLRHGSEIDARERGGASALYYASATGAPELVRMLLDAGANVHQGQDGRVDLLAAAAGSGNVEVARLLLDAGAPVDSGSGRLSKALIEAATYGQSEMVVFLLDHGAAAHSEALYALSLGCNSPEVARFLVAGGSTTAKGRTQTLLNALRRDSDEDCAALAHVLLAWDIELDQVDTHGNTALILASRGGYADVVQSLLKKGAEPNARNRDGKTALDVAANKRIADLLRKGKKR